jgi:hypothetical protein
MEVLNGTPPTAQTGTTSLQLAPYSGAFFRLAEASVNYPGNQGGNIVYAGVDPQGNVDLTAPFTVNGGVLLTFNQNQDFMQFPVETSGPNLPALIPPQSDAQQQHNLQSRIAFHHPPRFNPHHPGRLEKWHKRVFGR